MSLFQHRVLPGLVLLGACGLPDMEGALAAADAGPDDDVHSQATKRVSQRATPCGATSLCFPAWETARAACDQALSTMLANGTLVAPASCEVVAETTSAVAAQSAAILRIQQADFEQPYLVALGSQTGSYERVVELMRVSAGINTAVALKVQALTFEELVPTGPLELRVEMQSVIDDHDCSGERSWRTQRSDVAFCGFDDTGDTYCLGPVPRALRTRETRYDPQTDLESSELVERYALDVSLHADLLIVRKTLGDVSDEVRPLLGTHRVREAVLLTRTRPFPN
jgi:hypothetical protein